MAHQPNRLRSSAFASLALLAASHAAAAGFLSSGPGARAAGMGGAFTGLADDASAVYYNPAGLAGQRGALMVEHVPIAEEGSGLAFGGARMNYFGLHYPSRIGTFGLGAFQFSIGDIETRASLDSQPNTVKVTQTAFFLPYAVQFGRISVGAAGKIVSYDLAGYRARGYGADLGAKASLYRGDTFLGRDTYVTGGLAIRNAAAPSLKLDQEATPLERVTAAGLAVTSLVREAYVAADDHVIHDQLTVAVDVARGNQDTPLGAALGLEYAYLGRYAVRGGYKTDGNNITFGIGAGGPASTVRFDYAADMAALAPQHRFTISWLFTAAPTPVEGGARLSAFRRSQLDKDRLKDRFVREGRNAAAQGRYEDAFDSFEKAAVVDPHDKTVADLVESSREGSRLAGVKVRLDASRRERGVANNAAASKEALAAVAFDPESREAADYNVQLRNELIKAGAVGDYESARREGVGAVAADFTAARADRNVAKMRAALRQIKALDPDNEAVWKPLEEQLAGDVASWSAEYVKAGQTAFSAGDSVAMARAVRRLRRVDAKSKELRGLARKLRKVSRSSGGSFYDTNYLQQLYNTAAAEYVLGNYESAANSAAILLRQNATHEDGNALVSRMRDEGRVSDAKEP